MKKPILLLVTVFLSLCSVTFAQTADTQRARDIKIAEGILSEIFGDTGSENAMVLGSINRNVRGEYIPGYGVHFTVSPGLSNFIHVRNLNSNSGEVRVEIQSDGNSSKSSDNEEETTDKILEYMTKYASLISGVPDEETIRVTYAPNQSGGMTWIYFQDGERSESKQSGISVWAEMSDLEQFRNGRITEQQLMNRIHTQTLDGDETHTDFNIFASVLETALNSADTEYLRVTRKPQMEYLPDLGVRYRIQVSTRPSVILDKIRILDGDFGFNLDSLRFNLDASLQLMDESLRPFVLQLDSGELSQEEREELRQEMEEQRREFQAEREELQKSLHNRFSSSSVDSLDLINEADAIMDQLLNVIEDYGSTLSSLHDDEMLMISVNWTGRSDDLPERTEVRIKKSDLLRGEEPNIEEIERR